MQTLWKLSQDGNSAYVPTPAELRVPLVASAQAALDKSDTTCMRILSAGQAIPATWQAYRVALRNIVNGSDLLSTVLPTQPTFVAGT